MLWYTVFLPKKSWLRDVIGFNAYINLEKTSRSDDKYGTAQMQLHTREVNTLLHMRT